MKRQFESINVMKAVSDSYGPGSLPCISHGLGALSCKESFVSPRPEFREELGTIIPDYCCCYETKKL